MNRTDGRAPSELRTTRLTPGFLAHAEGSVLIEAGRTRVICSASVEDRVPPFLRNSGKGWVTAEYGMLPRATSTRTQREATAGKVGGRTQEIQRLIGRSLRSVTRLAELGERTIWIDCDVIQADGGTRTASITGGFVALVLALKKLKENGVLRGLPVQDHVAATSVGVVGGTPMLDLAYEEDSRADVDMNVVKTGDGRFIEVQGTAEGPPFERPALDALLELADAGIRRARVDAARDPRRHRRSSLMTLVVATTNPGKMREITAILQGAPVDLRTLADFPPIAEPDETGATFAENARLKALYYSQTLELPVRGRRFRNRDRRARQPSRHPLRSLGRDRLLGEICAHSRAAPRTRAGDECRTLRVPRRARRAGAHRLRVRRGDRGRDCAGAAG